MVVIDHGEAGAAATMKSPVRAARSRSGRTAGRLGPASQELFSEESLMACCRPETINHLVGAAVPWPRESPAPIISEECL